MTILSVFLITSDIEVEQKCEGTPCDAYIDTHLTTCNLGHGSG